MLLVHHWMFVWVPFVSIPINNFIITDKLKKSKVLFSSQQDFLPWLRSKIVQVFLNLHMVRCRAFQSVHLIEIDFEQWNQNHLHYSSSQWRLNFFGNNFHGLIVKERYVSISSDCFTETVESRYKMFSRVTCEPMSPSSFTVRNELFQCITWTINTLKSLSWLNYERLLCGENKVKPFIQPLS